jgi:precorrin-6B methylase 2
MGSALLAIEGAPAPAAQQHHLTVVPGSHALGRISHVPLGGGLLGADPARVAALVGADARALRPAAQGGGRFAAEELRLEAGDCVFLHALLLRQFVRNGSPARRAFSLSCFSRADNAPLRPAAAGAPPLPAPLPAPLPDDALLAVDPHAPEPPARPSAAFLYPRRYGADGTLEPVTERWSATPCGGPGAPPVAAAAAGPPAVEEPRARVLASANAPPRALGGGGGSSDSGGCAPVLAPFNPTAHDAIVEALALAALAPGDVLLDLGCGDGRVAIEAARSCAGVLAIGYDTNAAVLQRGLDRLSARAACGDPAEKEAAARVSLLCGDASKAGTEGVTVAFVYLVPEGLQRVKPLLERVLERGGRVVSNMFKVPGWEHKAQRVARGCSIYLYGR